MAIRLKKLAEATAWLPGFGPGEDPLQLATAIAVEQEAANIPLSSFAMPVAVVEERVKRPVWPQLLRDVHAGLAGEVTKFDANVAAIRRVRELASSGEQPTKEDREILNRFTGWGSAPWAFTDYHTDAGRRERAALLKGLLAEEEFEKARESTLNAHFTPLAVIEAVWAGVKQMGFTGGRILDPSSGSGFFLGAMPTEIAEQSTVTAIEPEAMSATLLRSLYGQYGVRVLEEGFEAAKLPKDFFDLVVSNVPFGNFKVPELRHVPFKDWSIHNYFFARALEVVRPGGIVAFVTSSYTMDASNTAVREYLAQRADLISAVRLPSDTFKALGNTSVTTDILFLRKREKAADGDATWTSSPTYLRRPHEMLADNAYSTVSINPWFVENPGAVLGKLSTQSNGYNSYALACIANGDFEPALLARMEALPEGVYQPKVEPAVKAVPRAVMVAASREVKPGAYVLTDEGQLAVSEGDTWRVVEAEMQAAKVRRIKGILPIRDAARELVASQVATDDDRTLAVYRQQLSLAYDAFVAQHGPLNGAMNRRAFREDPDFPLVLSLERWDDETQTAEKADIFSRRTVAAYRAVDRCETAADALLVTLAERGRVVPQRIGQLLGMDPDTAMASLREEGLVFLDPATDLWVERGEYLSGNVREKRAVAMAAGEAFADQAEVLAGVIPSDLSAEEIIVKLGANWIPGSDYEDFTEHLFDNSASFRYSEATGTWTVNGGDYGVKSTQTWGTDRVSGGRLLELAMNLQTPKVTDADPEKEGRRIPNVKQTLAAREKQEAIKQEFVRWLWSDEARRNRLVRVYNDRFNSVVNRTFDGSHLVLPGFSQAYNLHAHQRNAIWRILSSGRNTLLAHVVGAGKTLSMICAAMEMRRMGLTAKPCIVVPNHMLEQFAAEFLRAYPSARVLIASKDDMTGDRRRVLMARVATGDWDAVIITHASFELLQMSDAVVKSHISGIIAEFEALIACEHGNTRQVKQLERAKKVWQVRLLKRAAGKAKDEVLAFDELGIDALFVDEFHYFKNLYRLTRLRMAGLPASDSQRAFDMLLKSQHIVDKRGDGRGLVAATGTPIANSVAEMWVMQTYLQPETLEANGVAAFDAWAQTFGEEVASMELAPEGSGYRLHSRFARFINVPELMAIFREVADIQTAEMIKLPVPEAVFETVTVPASSQLKAFVGGLVIRADKIRNGEVKPHEDNMLAVTTEGRKAATDVRLVGINKDLPESKVRAVADKVIKHYVASMSTRGTQLVFLDLSTPNANWSLYEDLRRNLCADGIPHAEIAFIHDAATDKAKEALFQAVREGRIRVLMGSTSKMGCGTNVQNRLVALHHFDAPWRPSDVEQREGRIVRQGNLNAVVRIYRFVTEGSFDVYIWQTLETKQKFIAQVFRGDTSVRTLEDAELAALSFAEVKALATGCPMVIEKAGVDAEVMRLSMLRSQWREQQARNRCDIAGLPERIAKFADLLQRSERDAAELPSLVGDDFHMEVGGRVYDDREAAGEAVLRKLEGMRLMDRARIGSVGELRLEAVYRSVLAGPELFLSGHRNYETFYQSASPLGMSARITHAVQHIAGEPACLQGYITRESRRLEQLQTVTGGAFQHQQRLDALLARKAEIDKALGVFEGDHSVEVDVDVAEAA